MRRAWLAHAPTLAAFMVMMLVAGGLAISLDPGAIQPAVSISATTATAIPLPAPEDDGDNDTYADGIDRWFGNAMVRMEFTHVDIADTGVRPYIMVGTRDDHQRFGLGRDLQWRHVVDPDGVGGEPGSTYWADTALRTGLWLKSPSNDGIAISSEPSVHPGDAKDWPWVAWFDVREDAAEATFTIELWDDKFGRDELLGEWSVGVGDRVSTDSDFVMPGESLSLSSEAGTIQFSAQHALDIGGADAAQIADRWAPVIHFDSGEVFYPTDPDLLERFHGFAHRDPDHRTWSRTFNNARDGYRLLVADFNGDRLTDHEDVQLLWDILRAGADSDKVYAHVGMATGDRVVAQYWFIYPYNFVQGENGQDIAALAHAGDREFVQFLFSSVEDALNGTPESVSFSQHYHGVRFDNPAMDEAPFQDGRLHVYPARGSHASYPAPGDDSRLRPAFVGYGDNFDGAGITWTPSDYEVELLDTETWHAGYKWGPATRFHRELGSAGRPLLVHSFVYPWHEPVRWANQLEHVTPDELPGLYGAAQ